MRTAQLPFYHLHHNVVNIFTCDQTYNTDAQGADSAGTATAFFCGVKTKSGVIGVDDQIIRSNCESGLNASVDSIMIDAERAGKTRVFF